MLWLLHKATTRAGFHRPDDADVLRLFLAHTGERTMVNVAFLVTVGFEALGNPCGKSWSPLRIITSRFAVLLHVANGSGGTASAVPPLLPVGGRRWFAGRQDPPRNRDQIIRICTWWHVPVQADAQITAVSDIDAVQPAIKAIADRDSIKRYFCRRRGTAGLASQHGQLKQAVPRPPPRIRLRTSFMVSLNDER